MLWRFINRYKECNILKKHRFKYFIIRTISYTQYNNTIQKKDSNYYLYDLYKSLETCKNGHELYKLSRKTLKYQIYDLYIWRIIEQKFYDLHMQLQPKEISSIINYFKQMKIVDSKIYENSINIILSSINSYSLHDLSVICLSYVYLKKINILFMNKIANAIIKLYEEDKKNIPNLNKNELSKYFISYVHIIGAYGQIKQKNIELFKIASVYIYAALNTEILIPPKFIIKIVNSYFDVKIKHSKIFDLIAKQIPTIKITDEELKTIKQHFDALKYFNETLDKYIQYRLL
ncbi:conserved protein, unknown function [Hepatocystis sp. ex Piliocolobus tephrosceles]|nr:conserved protein, unknown function [Hepatocystis sp. ex Piliocolobus tephrosceles]